MICPDCQTSYTDEYLYCLADGVQLVDDDAEFPTVVRANRSGNGSFDPPCPTCGLSNKVGARFCKRCGVAVADPAARPVTIPVAAPPPPVNPVAAPPLSGTAAAPTRSALPFVVIGVGAVILVIVVGVVAYNVGAGGAAANNSAANNTNRPANSANSNIRTPTPVTNVASNSTPASNSLIGRTGTLTTDVNLRDTADRTSLKVGTHYQGARVRILDTAEAPNDEGSMSTWYRIQVTSYGSSSDPKNQGLDKDPGSADEGWINSNPKIYDAAKKTQIHKRTVDFDQP